VRLDPVTVVAPPLAATSSEVIIPRRDLELLPPGRPAEALRLIPGFIINQHQGGGKAEQYLLRGFDADHGTDVALFVDSLPVNLRSHAHPLHAERAAAACSAGWPCASSVPR